MNKKISILILSFILISSLAYAAKANSFSDALNTFANQLYWLRDNLKAQVNSGTSKPQLTSAMTSCNANSDCSLTETWCCSCANGGSEESIKAINKNHLVNFKAQLSNFCFVDNHFACLTVYNCDKQKIPTGAICENKVCKATFQKSIPEITAGMTSCNTNSDCVLTGVSCCGGCEENIKAINKDNFAVFNQQRESYCINNNINCLAVEPDCDQQKMPTGAICENKVCEISWFAHLPNPGPYPPALPPGYPSPNPPVISPGFPPSLPLPSTTTTTREIKHMTKEQLAAQAKINDECAKISKIEARANSQGDFSKTTAIANLIRGYTGESLQIDCVLTPSISKALGNYKGNSLHVWVSYAPLQTSSAIELVKFNGNTLSVKTSYPVADAALSTLVNFRGKVLNIGIMNNLYAGMYDNKFTLNGPVGASLGNFKGEQLTIDKINSMAPNAAKGLANFAGKFLSINTKSNSSIEYFSEAKVNHLELKGFNTITNWNAKGLAKFKGQILWLPSITTITKSVAEELVKFSGHTISLDSITTADSSVLETLAKFKGTVMVLTRSIYDAIREHQIALGNAVLPPTTTTSTIPVESWYKLTTFLGCKMDEWTKTCIDTNAATSSGDAYKFCMNQYLLSKKITFTDLTVKNLPAGTITCMACGCEMPEIYLKAKTNFDNALKLVGFTKSNDPSKIEEQKTDPNKIKIDLLTQGFFFKENKENNKINYKVLTKNSNSSCGDGRCDLLEQYLYELDFSKNCSPLVDKMVNFYHCSLDCKTPLDASSAVSQDEFNKLQFECTNNTQEQEEKVNTVIPQPIKPIAEMNQVEKNSYIMQLQQVLISLLTQLLNMLKK